MRARSIGVIISIAVAILVPRLAAAWTVLPEDDDQGGICKDVLGCSGGSALCAEYKLDTGSGWYVYGKCYEGAT